MSRQAPPCPPVPDELIEQARSGMQNLSDGQIEKIIRYYDWLLDYGDLRGAAKTDIAIRTANLNAELSGRRKERELYQERERERHEESRRPIWKLW